MTPGSGCSSSPKMRGRAWESIPGTERLAATLQCLGSAGTTELSLSSLELGWWHQWLCSVSSERESDQRGKTAPFPVELSTKSFAAPQQRFSSFPPLNCAERSSAGKIRSSTSCSLGAGLQDEGCSASHCQAPNLHLSAELLGEPGFVLLTASQLCAPLAKNATCVLAAQRLTVSQQRFLVANNTNGVLDNQQLTDGWPKADHEAAVLVAKKTNDILVDQRLDNG